MPGTDDWIDKAAITELITRYVALNDAGDWQGLAALYTQDGRMNRPTAPDEFVDGRDAILASFEARPQRVARHIVANVLVFLDDADHARATSNILLFTAADAPPLVGTYRDRLEKTSEGWRFVERCGSLDF